MTHTLAYPLSARRAVLFLGTVLVLSTAFVLSAPSAFAQGCVSDLRAGALAAGIAPGVFDRQMAGFMPDPAVIEASQSQPELQTPIWDYMASLVDDERVRDGSAMLKKYGGVLSGIEKRYGVDAPTVVAVWGVESNFGQTTGKYRLVPALATLACHGRRAAYFRGELFATLKIVQRGDVRADHLVGSWAGAFGQTQFMPSTFLRTAVDGDGDGRRDIVDSVPDALASTANYLAKSGWTRGARWGFEVQLPTGFKSALAGRKRKRALSAWAAMGVTRINGAPLPQGEAPAAILLPSGAKGPAFLTFRNFDAIFSYNAAESYALAISHLSDRLRGGGRFVTPWPTNDAGLSRAERRELQEMLTKIGYDVGAANGMIGAKTRAAVKDIQRQLGLPQTGRAGQQVLMSLRRK